MVSQKFCFAGVEFNVELSQLDGEDYRLTHTMLAGCVVPERAAPTAAQVRCLVSTDQMLRGERGAALQWRRQSEDHYLSSAQLTASLRKAAARDYLAHVAIFPSAAALADAVMALATAVLYLEGGLVFHAATVELDSRALLFIGHSGAGKTTAANQMRDCRWVSADRAAVVPDKADWQIWPLPGGTVSELKLPKSHAPTVRAAGILGLRHGREVAIEPLPRYSAIAMMRSALQVPPGLVSELAVLDQLERLSSTVPVARLVSSLKEECQSQVFEWAFRQGISV